jgi:hypothetical protein
MVLSVTFLLTILLTIIVFRTRSLHNLEVVVLLLFISNIVNNVYSMWGLNLNYIFSSDRIDEFISFVLVCSVLIPALITCILGISFSLGSLIWRSFIMAISPFTLLAIEYMADAVGIIEHQQISIWNSLLVWYLVIIIAFIFRSGFFSLLKGE